MEVDAKALAETVAGNKSAIHECQAQMSRNNAGVTKLPRFRLSEILLQACLIGNGTSAIRNTSFQGCLKHDVAVREDLFAVVMSFQWRVHAPRDWCALDEGSDAVAPPEGKHSECRYHAFAQHHHSKVLFLPRLIVQDANTIHDTSLQSINKCGVEICDD